MRGNGPSCVCLWCCSCRVFVCLSVGPVSLWQSHHRGAAQGGARASVWRVYPWMFRKTLRKVLRTYIRSPWPYTRGRKVFKRQANPDSSGNGTPILRRPVLTRQSWQLRSQSCGHLTSLLHHVHHAQHLRRITRVGARAREWALYLYTYLYLYLYTIRLYVYIIIIVIGRSGLGSRSHYRPAAESVHSDYARLSLRCWVGRRVVCGFSSCPCVVYVRVALWVSLWVVSYCVGFFYLNGL